MNANDMKLKTQNEIIDNNEDDDITLNNFNDNELDQLAEKAKSGNKEDIEKVIKKVDRLISYVVAKTNYKTSLFDYDDLYQEGALGVVHAIKKYDISKNIRFTTYCYKWIQSYVKRYIDYHSTTVNMGCHVSNLMRQRYLLKEKYPELSEDEIYDLLKNDGRSVIISKESYMNALNGVDHYSLDKNVIINNQEKDVLLNHISDKRIKDVEDSAVDEALYDEILSQMEYVLDDREKDIVSSHLGLNTDSEETLADIARRYDLSRERVRVLYVKAIAKLQDAMQVPLAERSTYIENNIIVKKMVYKYLDEHPNASVTEVYSKIPVARTELKPPIGTYYHEYFTEKEYSNYLKKKVK